MVNCQFSIPELVRWGDPRSPCFALQETFFWGAKPHRKTKEEKNKQNKTQRRSELIFSHIPQATIIPTRAHNNLEKKSIMMEPGSFLWCPVRDQEAAGTNLNKGGSLQISGNDFWMRKWPSISTSHPHGVSSLEISKRHLDMGLGTCSEHPCLNREVTRWTQRSLPTLATLWFCENGREQIQKVAYMLRK